MVSSDHAPWPLEEKTRPAIFDNHSGAPGTETLVTVLAAGLLERGWDLGLLSQIVAATPARIFGISHAKGSLTPGMDADVMAFDPQSPFTLDEGALHSNAGWSPYHGMAFPGRVVLTVLAGRSGLGRLPVAGFARSRPRRRPLPRRLAACLIRSGTAS